MHEAFGWEKILWSVCYVFNITLCDGWMTCLVSFCALFQVISLKILVSFFSFALTKHWIV